MLFSNRIDAETCNLQDTCLADTYSLPATCQQNPATCPTEPSNLPNSTLPPANSTINLNHNL